MKIITRFSLIASLIMLSLPAMAQEDEGSLFTPGTNFEMTAVKANPTYWVNKANEANVYFETKDGITLLTMQSDKKPGISEIANTSLVYFSDHGFMLQGDKDAYFFGLGTKESSQYLQILKYSVTGEIKMYEGYGIAKHQWPKDKAPSLAVFKAAKSIYDVVGK
ncbi:hypothetical protein [uncultured Flavobacterium sp.]|uniref:hypothetical protein n=1 Tax=uncultured Flavobacterium sp. TaxID=165435 RepID=UPI0025EAE687|nr:hypothetical protein [uncultured Flavobacterium sp.]